MKTKGFTLVETMVAMLLMALSFGIWMMVFSNIDLNQSAQQLDHDSELDMEFSKIIQERNYFDEEYSVDRIDYSRKVEFSEEQEDLLTLELIAFVAGEEIGSRKEIIYLP